MTLKIKSKKNLLVFVPIKSDNAKFEQIEKEDGLITIVIHRNSLFDKFVRKCIKQTPNTFKVDLDEFGSFVYNNIDGTKNIYELGQEVKKRFGDDCEPLYERLGAFCNLLKNNDFIVFRKDM